MNTAVAKVGMAAIIGHCTIHHHGGHARSRFVGLARTFSVAVGRVSIRFLVVAASSEVLDTHQIFLPLLVDIEPKNMVRVVIDTTRKFGNMVPFCFEFPGDLDASLHGLSILRQARSTTSIGDCSFVKFWLGLLLHRLAFFFRDEVFNNVNLRCRAIVLDMNCAPSTIFVNPSAGRNIVCTLQFLVDTSIVFQFFSNGFPDSGLKSNFFVDFFQTRRDATFDTQDQIFHGFVHCGLVILCGFQSLLCDSLALFHQICRLFARLDFIIDKFRLKLFCNHHELIVIFRDRIGRFAANVVGSLATNAFIPDG
mmetsp:Transcript_16241/g.30928  ORF Transcript_16241/g.30928 Transcript_16241/m.30928 type:complete len:309 (-) Transcript_16241:353-1279(-)